MFNFSGVLKMLFNSYVFIMALLPISLALYYIFDYFNMCIIAQCALIFCSLVFYGFYNPFYVIVLCISILINYFISKVIIKYYNAANRISRWFMIIGVVGNLLLLFWFKYYDFFISNINQALKTSFQLKYIALPLGISFFTFQQISYIVDTYRGETGEYTFIEYCNFVSFFPQLVAGPIVLHNEIIPQFRGAKKWDWENAAIGFEFLTIGLFKKVIIADTFGLAVNWGYENYSAISSLECIMVVLFYTFQIYFDFSGYCDMATGIARMFGIVLPINFDSPYQASSILDFWDRWHMSLTRFLRQYVYFPLGGNRRGAWRTRLNVLIVYLLSGFWHGANWTFVLWGMIHGLGSIINREMKEFWNKIPRFFSWILTFLFINLTWLIFRADSISQAKVMIKRIIALDKWNVSKELFEKFNLVELVIIEKRILGGILTKWEGTNMTLFIVSAFCAIWFMKPCVKKPWRPIVINGVVIAIMFVWSFLSLAQLSTFLYFDF